MIHINTHNGSEFIIIQYPTGYWMYLSHGKQQRVGMVRGKLQMLRIIVRFVREVM